MPHCLVVEDDPNCLFALAELVEQEGFTTSTASTLEDARLSVSARPPDLILLDLMLPDGNGIHLLKDVEALGSAQVVLITGHPSVDTAVEAFRMGVSDFMTKPVDIPRLKHFLANFAHGKEIMEEAAAIPVEKEKSDHQFGLLLGCSTAMHRVYDLIKKVARPKPPCSSRAKAARARTWWPRRSII